MYALISGAIPFAGGSYLAYSILDGSIAKPPGDQLTPVYIFVSGCLAATVAKVWLPILKCVLWQWGVRRQGFKEVLEISVLKSNTLVTLNL